MDPKLLILFGTLLPLLVVVVVLHRVCVCVRVCVYARVWVCNGCVTGV